MTLESIIPDGARRLGLARAERIEQALTDAAQDGRGGVLCVQDGPVRLVGSAVEMEIHLVCVFDWSGRPDEVRRGTWSVLQVPQSGRA